VEQPGNIGPDKALEVFERSKKQSLSGFSLITLWIAIAIALTIEFGALVKVWRATFPTDQRAIPVLTHQDENRLSRPIPGEQSVDNSSPFKLI
jgi:hypothetical protein